MLCAIRHNALIDLAESLTTARRILSARPPANMVERIGELGHRSRGLAQGWSVVLINPGTSTILHEDLPRQSLAATEVFLLNTITE
jgi:hypothetical protein